MRYYPLLLDLHGKNCLIVGLGKVGQRKLETLLKAEPASILILDTLERDAISEPAIATLLTHKAVSYEQREFRTEDVKDKALVFACTGNRLVNKTIADAANQHSVLCNIIDDPAAGSFTVPAHIEKGDLLITLSTGGASPALSRVIKNELETQVGDKYAPVVTLMGRVRPLILAHSSDTAQNTAVFRSIVKSEIAEAIQEKNLEKAKIILQATLPDSLHSNIGALLHELI